MLLVSVLLLMTDFTSILPNSQWGHFLFSYVVLALLSSLLETETFFHLLKLCRPYTFWKSRRWLTLFSNRTSLFASCLRSYFLLYIVRVDLSILQQYCTSVTNYNGRAVGSWYITTHFPFLQSHTVCTYQVHCTYFVYSEQSSKYVRPQAFRKDCSMIHGLDIHPESILLYGIYPISNEIDTMNPSFSLSF